ncbi:hypothetical protein FISHEDRAFT_70592 [Fistulina hepatica ATCC 64428]|uniref:Uncharacterized protein n=1 Tax=Fistulina hepatica ATCC 64428 TaxID=1128425 RepID=A0A0D7AJ47_9AGAR|nr:hypothetical protein FISHEDRAFT_70592 [Fistulina hepatica ATCC 64428]
MGIHHVVTAAVTAAPYAFGSWTSRRRQESGAETSTSSREGVDDHWRGSARSSLHGAKASASSRARSSPEIPSAMLRTSSTLDRVPEDDPVEFNPLLDNPEDPVDDGDDEDEDWQAQLDAVLDEQGLYEGSYKNLLFLFTFVPLTFVAALAVAALLLLIFPPQFENPFPYTRVSPSPLPEILTGVSLWSLIYLLRNPLSSISIALIPSSPTLSSVLFSLVHGILSIIARLAALSMLLIAHYMEFATPTWKDAAFTRVWWIAVGWAFAEGVVAVQQGYACLALYRDVLVIVKRYTGTVDTSSKITIRRSVDTAEERREASVELPGDIRWELEQDVDQLIALRNREELEEIYGVPFIRIPVFVPCL